MSRTHRVTFAVIVTVCALTLLSGPPAEAQTDHYTAYWKLFRLPENNESGMEGLLAVLMLTPEEGWYTYAHVPGAFGQPTTLTVKLMPEDRSLRPLYTKGVPKKDPLDPNQFVNIYEGTTPLFVPLETNTESNFNLQATIRMLLCSDVNCLPLESEFMFLGSGIKVAELPSAKKESWWPMFVEAARDEAGRSRSVETTRAASQKASEFVDQGAPSALAPRGEGFDAPAEWNFHPAFFRPSLEVTALIPAILFGLLAGFLLNFMPCVLPVVTLKLSAVLAATKTVEGHPAKQPGETLFREHNIFFALGVLIYFLCISGLLAFTGMAWGQLFQNSMVVTILTAVVFALSLSLFGFYNLPIVDLKTTTASNPRAQAFFTGFLATLLATPCSGPFLGGVLGWALLQPPHVVGAVFMSIGLGMASPYIAMTYFPRLVRFFPKPGAWTLYLERVVGFFLLGTCIYLMGILPESELVACLILLWFTALAAWLWGMAGPGTSTGNRLILRLAALMVVAAGAYMAFLPPEPGTRWEEFNAQTFTSRLGHERMLVDFTADWCPTCKVLEKTVLTDDNIRVWSRRYGLKFIQADMTGHNPEAGKLLQILGSRSLPVVAIFDKGTGYDRPLVIRDIFTTGQLDKALESLGP